MRMVILLRYVYWKIVIVKWIESKENQADIMTEPLPIQSYLYIREQIF